jgi:hypothetical protein
MTNFYRKVQDELSNASEHERLKWMRRRFLWFCVFLAVVSVFDVLRGERFVQTLPDVLEAMICVGGYWTVRRKLSRASDIVRYGFWFIAAIGALTFFVEPLFQGDLRRLPGSAFGSVVSIHLIAALFLPWTVREAIKALLMLCFLGFASSLVYAPAQWASHFALVFLPFTGLPGIIVCWFRHSRLRRRVALKHLTHRYGALKYQLEHARAIHEMVFPAPIQEGPIRMTYSYEPMLDIGGDFLYVRPCSDGALSVVVVDVNGHGIGAALSVNRVYGELERIFGENENLRPDEVLIAMNHYFLVTLARKGVFATAFSLRVEPGVNGLAWANAGHPPGLVVRESGELQKLESHAVMLGVLDDGMFQCELQRTSLNDDDRLRISGSRGAPAGHRWLCSVGAEAPGPDRRAVNGR